MTVRNPALLWSHITRHPRLWPPPMATFPFFKTFPLAKGYVKGRRPGRGACVRLHRKPAGLGREEAGSQGSPALGGQNLPAHFSPHVRGSRQVSGQP